MEQGQEELRFVKSPASDVLNGARPSTSDDELAAASARGDPEAFALLYHRYKLDVWHLAWFTLHDHHEAEDVVQETFVKAHRSLGQYHRTGSLRAWLLTICRNACRDRLRAHRRRDALPLDEELVATAVADREQLLDVQQALAQLPAEEREAFLLVDVLGCHSEEAARIAGVRAPSTLRSRVARARRAIAPAVADPAPPAAARLWGLLHDSEGSAIVVSHAGGAAAPPQLDDVLATARSGSVGLLAFLDRVDAVVPAGRAVVAVVNAHAVGGAAAAAPWLARHPAWRMRHAPTQATWLGEVDGLLQRCLPWSLEDLRRVHARLAARDPFVWTASA